MDFTLNKSNSEKEVPTPQLVPLPEMSGMGPWGEHISSFACLSLAVPHNNYENVKHFRASHSLGFPCEWPLCNKLPQLLRVQDFLLVQHDNFIYHNN